MYDSALTCTSWWWIFPLIMMILCFLMMRKRRGSMICGFGSLRGSNYPSMESDSAKEVLDKRYASGEISRDEYEEIKKAITNPTNELSE